MAVTTKAVFLDKDGTLIENLPYNVDPDRIRFTAGAVEGLLRLQRLGYLLVGVSNQPGIALGYFTETALDAVTQRMRALLAVEGVTLTGLYYCPHDPAGRSRRYAMRCRCRKPAPGLLLAAAHIHDIDVTQSWLIGDILDDIEAGERAGCRTVLIDNGNETVWKHGPYREPTYRAPGLAEAALLIEQAPVCHRAPAYKGEAETFVNAQRTFTPPSARQDAELGARQGRYPAGRQTKPLG